MTDGNDLMDVCPHRLITFRIFDDTKSNMMRIFHKLEQFDKSKFISSRKCDEKRNDEDERTSDVRVFKPIFVDEDRRESTFESNKGGQPRAETSEAGKRITEEFTEEIMNRRRRILGKIRNENEMKKTSAEKNQCKLIDETHAKKIMTNTLKKT